MPLQSRTIATSGTMRSFKEVNGLGRESFGLSTRSLVFEGGFRHWEKKDQNVRLIPWAGMMPFPTIRRAVSGKVTRIRRRQKPPVMHKNQNIDFQPRDAASAPPMTGPRGGATFGLNARHLARNLSNSVGGCTSSRVRTLVEASQHKSPDPLV